MIKQSPLTIASKRVSENEFQNYRMPNVIWKEVADRKNIYMLTYRVANNYSQERAARNVRISTHLWMNLENKREIPTEEVASAISFTLGKDVWVVFPITRPDFQRMYISIRRMSKLAMYRAVKGIAQVDLARRAGVPLKTLHGLERLWKTGEDIPAEMMVNVQTVADFIGCDIVDIIGDYSPEDVI